MYALRYILIIPFIKKFIKNWERCKKKLIIFFHFLIKNFLKWFTIICPKCIH